MLQTEFNERKTSYELIISVTKSVDKEKIAIVFRAVIIH